MYFMFHAYTCVSWFPESTLVKGFGALAVVLPSLGDGRKAANIISSFHGPHWMWMLKLIAGLRLNGCFLLFGAKL